MNDKIRLNKYGFYELISKPNNEEISAHYKKKYYQDNLGGYNQTYSEEELIYIKNKIIQKDHVLSRFLSKEKPTLLDVGCGEGFSLKYYYDKGWQVLGIDFSSTGLFTHNAQMKPYFIQGDVFQELKILIDTGFKADVIWLDNVLEHALDPLLLLKNCHKLASKESILVVEVPNDFSLLQRNALAHQHIDKPNWIHEIEHISYFNPQGLENLAKEAKWGLIFQMTDFPIDIFLFNEYSNYYRYPERGKAAHHARIRLENIFHNSNKLDDLIDLYQVLLKNGIGRQIISYFKLLN